jgi:hypothetical protein
MLVKPIPDPGSNSRIFLNGNQILVIGQNGVFKYDSNSNSAIPIEGVRGTPFPQNSGFRRDQMWILTTDGAFRYDWQSGRAFFVAGETGSVYAVLAVRNEFWLSTEKGLFWYDSQQDRAVRIPGPNTISITKLIDDELWVAPDPDDEDDNDNSYQEELTFRCNVQRRECSLVRGVYGAVNEIVSLLGTTWLTTESGIFRYDPTQKKVTRIEGYGQDSTSITLAGGMIWVYTPPDYEEELLGDSQHAKTGTFLAHVDLKNNRAIPVQGGISYVSDVEYIDGETWIIAENGAFRYDPARNTAMRVNSDTGEVTQAVKVGQDILFAGDSGVFRWDNGSKLAQPIGDSSAIGKVTTISQIGSEVWLYGKTASRYDPDLKKVLPIGGSAVSDVNGIYLLDGQIWLTSIQQGAFCYDREHNRLVSIGGNTGGITRALSTKDGIWLEAPKGAFRYDPVNQVSLKVKSWFTGFSGFHAWAAGSTSLTAAYPTVNAPETDVIIASTRDELLQKTNSGSHWSNITDAKFEIFPGWAKLYVAYKDTWGNQRSAPNELVLQGLALPTWSFLSGLVVLLGIGSMMLCLCIAPYSRLAQLVLMNPFLRSVGSFGLIPIVLTLVTPARRHLFLRYRRKLMDDGSFSRAARQYVTPDPSFEAQAFMKALEESDQRTAVIQGQSGIGKSAFMMYLAHTCADPQRGNTYVPVLIDLGSMAGKCKDAVAAKLKKFGEITDASLVDVFLNHGGFLLLLDGLNELSREAAREVFEFVETNRDHNIFCITVQVANRELSRIGVVHEIGPLGKDKIEELIRRFSTCNDETKPAFSAEGLLEKFSDTTYRICRVPLQLELVLDIWQRQGKVPENLDDVFKYALSSVLDAARWGEEHPDYPEILSKVAYGLLTEKRAYDPRSHDLPQPIIDELIDRKLLLVHGDIMEFRHAKIEAYLAFLYFKNHWRSLLTDPKTIVDQNWDSMIEFHMTQEQNPSSARGILLLLLDRDYETAIRCFGWIRLNRPELCEKWQDQFNLALARKVTDAVPMTFS